MITIKGLFRASVNFPFLAGFLLTAHLASGHVHAQSSEVDSSKSTNDEITLLGVMQTANLGYAKAVVIHILHKLVTATVFLEGTSVVSLDSPSPEILAECQEQLARASAVRAMAASFDFGPIHSLGYAAAMDTRADIGGLEQLVASDSADVALLRDAAKNPWLKGCEAINYLFDSGSINESSVEKFTRRRLLHLQILATELRQTTRFLLESLTTWADDYPAYNSKLSTAGNPIIPHCAFGLRGRAARDH